MKSVPSQRWADLHVHTHFSDGSFSPDEVVQCALQNSLAAIGITDHDSIGGIEPAMASARKTHLEVVPGVELTAEANNKEIHMLGYYIDWQNSEFQDRLTMLQEVRRKRAEKMVERLEELGVNISFPDVQELAGVGAIGRLHLAQIILQAGYVNSVEEAFQRYIGDNSPAYVKKYRLTPSEAIEMIVEVGGIPVLAHPSLLNNDELIPQLVKDGLKGIEVCYTNQNLDTSCHYQNLAREYGLIPTGGSDCHGLAKGAVLMGKVKVPYKWLERLREAMGK
ncbi:PHP domain-containing protein [candidate division NPL-UPA2 bacterium]|nr:PHP domain-containing protein [candidate division NPL-UPA2 bacterium]